MTSTALFEKALDEGDGEYIWKALHDQLSVGSDNGSGLFGDPHFVKEVEDIIVFDFEHADFVDSERMYDYFMRVMS